MSLLKSSALDLKIIHIVYMKQDWLLRASLEIQHSVVNWPWPLWV